MKAKKKSDFEAGQRRIEDRRRATEASLPDRPPLDDVGAFSAPTVDGSIAVPARTPPLPDTERWKRPTVPKSTDPLPPELEHWLRPRVSRLGGAQTFLVPGRFKPG